MINGVWLFLLAGGIIWGLITGNGTVVMQSALGGAETAVTLSIKLVGVMCLWLGMLKIAEKAGVLRIFARIVRPLTRWLFPSVPTDHPAMGAVVMTITANMLGMGNAGGIMDSSTMRIYLQAGATLCIAPPLILYLFFQKYFTESIERTGLVG